MRRSSILLALIVVIGVLPGAAQAQRTTARTASAALPAAAQAYVVRSDTLLQFRTRAAPGGRMDVDAGVLRAAYRIGRRVAPAATPEAAARAYLTAEASRFGWTPEADDLVERRVLRGRYTTHVVYQQTFYGLPVYNRQVKVSLDGSGQPTMVLSGYAPHLRTVRDFDPFPTLAADAATGRARQLVSVRGARTSPPELVVYPDRQPRLAWHLLAWPDDAPAEWEVLLDARTGAVIRLFDQSTHAHGEREKGREGERQRGRKVPEAEPPGINQDRSSTAPSKLSPIYHPLSTFVDGTGLVFDPDPLTTAGVDYGGAYVDAGDTDVEALNAQRIEVVLNDITQGSDGLYRLEGPFAVVDGSASIGGNAFTPPAEADPNGFRYGRADDAFEAVMSYYHVDKSQRYVQSLDVGRAIQAVPVRVNPHGLGAADDSKYFLSQNAIALGDGGIDDAEDADVIWHEYGHALLQDSAPGLLNTNEGQALHEGWSDYWAASYSRGLVEAGTVPPRDWRKVFTWDGNETWNGRRLDRAGVYPGALVGNIYDDGLLWATTLMEIYDDLQDRAVLDRLNLASHGYLGPPVTFADAAEALIQADVDLYDGAHLGVLINRLGIRGYVDPSSFGPILAHEPIPYVEQVGGTVTVEADALPVTASIDRVALFYSVNAGPFEELPLGAQGGDRYSGAFTLPSEAVVVDYYLKAFDAAGLETRLPADAPQQTFRFGVGPDTTPPQIAHEPIQQASIQAWPVTVVADVQDNQGVDSVWVIYSIEPPGGTPSADGSFGLSLEAPGRYTGAFPVPAGALQEGSTVRYRLQARDVATGVNETALPVTGDFAFEIVVGGVLAAYSFEGNQGLQATGVWERGAPTFGLQVAHGGEGVWGTRLDTPYPAFSQSSTLDLPPINLAGVAQAYLVFWHWYDFEYSGTVAPGAPSEANLWDGGNVKVSTDGASWVVLAPTGGYTGILESGTGNPLQNEAVFGGYSFGWRREVVVLPPFDNLRVRFDFGTDGSNELASLFYAGWRLDDVRITTTLTPDTTTPTLLAAPPDPLTSDAGQPPPLLVVQAQDNVGLETVRADYTVVAASGTQQGTLRLAMSTTDLATFQGAIPAASLNAGDRIEYRLTLRDFDGNTTLYPATGQPPLRIEVRLAESRSALRNLRASGLWQPTADGWTTVAGSAEPVSSLVLEPIDLPDNAEAISFTLAHRYRFGSELGGNLKHSVDGGATWQVLAPNAGYGASFAPGTAHPMSSEAVFAGQSNDLEQSVFDLSAFAGRQLRLRVDLGAAQTPQAAEFWEVEQATVRYATGEAAFDTPLELALHPNYPDPFTDNTTVNYTLPEAMPVRLEVYDILGRRVAVLVDAEQEAGTHTLTVGGGGLASGVYLLRMMAGGTQKVERMVITR